jgi:plastocyanin
MSPIRRLSSFASAVTVLALIACGGGEKPAPTPETPAVTPPATPGAQTPDEGGKVITVEMITDEQGNNKFVPNDIEAHKGDVLRFKLVVGVHNAHFLPDSNPGVQGLPAATQMLQAPGQTEDVKITWGPGRYYFQCDPHALLGMIGHLKVEDE